jgi:uncharacterized protein (DUF1778 family)
VGFTADDERFVREFTSPALSQVEWTAHQEPIHLSAKGFDRMQQLLAKPPAPAPALKAAISRKRR